jgi:hypothetical protein
MSALITHTKSTLKLRNSAKTFTLSQSQRESEQRFNLFIELNYGVNLVLMTNLGEKKRPEKVDTYLNR